MSVMNHAMAFGHIQLIKDGVAYSNLPSLGITEDDWELFTTTRHWIRDEHIRIRNVLDGLTNGTADVTGIHPFVLPAEYIASIIRTFVSPCNVMAACSLAERQPVGETIKGVDKAEWIPVTASEMFIYVSGLFGDVKVNNAAVAARLAFERRAGLEEKESGKSKKS